MKRKDKNINQEISDFLRYSGNKMSEEERNAFERKLQKDPFSDEASEGFSEVPECEAESDLVKLRLWLTERFSYKKKYLYYRIAASVAVLMIVSSVFIILDKTPVEKESVITSRVVTFDIPAAEAITKDFDNNIIEKQSGKAPSPEKKLAQPPGEEKVETILKTVDDKEIIAKIYAPSQSEIKKSKDIISTPPSAPASSVNEAKSNTDLIIYESNTDKPPEPVTGKENYDRYLKENLNPALLPEGSELTVTLKILIDPSGMIDTIRIIDSPGKIYSDEAIRLVKEGPAWNAATKNGEGVSGDVLLKIIFKK